MTQAGQSKDNGQIVPFQQKVTGFRATLDKLKGQIAVALPKHMKADRLMRIVLTSVQRVPKLLDCTRESLLGCIIQAAQLGLEPDGMLGHAYLIPYRDNKKGVMVCQLIVGYKGMLKLARQSGEIASIAAHVVHSNDEFSYSLGLDETLIHKPAAPVQDPEAAKSWLGPGPMIAVYAIAKLKDGTKQFEVMLNYEVDSIRSRSKASESGPWVTDYEEMAKKTALRRLCKMLPASVELQTAVALDERVDAGISQEIENVIDVTATEIGSDADPGVEAAPDKPEVSKLDKLVSERGQKKLNIQVPEEPASPAEGSEIK